MVKRQVALAEYGGQWLARYRERCLWWFWSDWCELVVMRRKNGLLYEPCSWGTEEEAQAAADHALSNGVIRLGAYFLPIVSIQE